jgi:hypothetical protein
VVLRSVFRPRRDEGTRDCRRLHNEKLHNLNTSPSVIGMDKSRKMKWAGYIARMERKEMRIGYWWGIQKEREY